MVRDKESGVTQAAKLIQKGTYGDEIQLMMRELHVLSRLQHENVLTLVAAFESPGSLMLVTDIGAILAIRLSPPMTRSPRYLTRLPSAA